MPHDKALPNDHKDVDGMTQASASAVLVNEVGLHARPSVKLPQTAKRFASKLEVAAGKDTAGVDRDSA